MNKTGLCILLVIFMLLLLENSKICFINTHKGLSSITFNIVDDCIFFFIDT